MIIKKYGPLAAIYAPDVGEVVHARRSIADKYVRAVVLHVRRVGEGLLEFKLEWRESDPATGGDGYPPVIAGQVGWVRSRLDGHPPALIRQIPGGGPLSG